MLSQLLLDRGELAQATEQANRAVQISPNFYGAWSQLGVCYARAGNLEGALMASEGGARAPGGGAPAQFNRALALKELAQREAWPASTWHRWLAWYHTRRALESDPNFQPARALLEQL
jgi:hypothetical protein